MDQFAAHKKDVEKQIVEIVAKNYEQEIIEYSDYQEIADFVLKGMQDVADQTSLISFLKELSWNWNMFQDLLTSEEAPIKQAQEQKAAENVAEMIEQGKPEQAIDTAKKVME